jgi:kumamolisin
MAKQSKRFVVKNSAKRLPKGSKVVGAANPDQHMEISLRIRAKPGSVLDDASLLALGAQPPSKRQYVSREEFAAKAGADPADVAKIDDFAHQHGLTVKSVHLESRTVKLTGTVKAFSAAFGVKLQNVKQKKGGTFRMRKGSVLVPEELKNIVVGVHGLDNRPVAAPHFRGKQSRARAAGARAAADGSFAATDVAKLYGFPTAQTGAGQCIAIIELSGGYKTADLAAYFKGAGIPAPSIAAISVDGGRNNPGHSNADVEVALDIEVAGAVAPGATIAVYFAPNTTNGFIDAVKAAAHDAVRKPSVISISWGSPEDPANAQQFLDGLNEAVRDAAAMGVTVCIATGDSGSSDMDGGGDGKPHADFPASSPFALACGGTRLTAADGQISKEVVWNDGPTGGGGGGGVSDYFALPPYQSTARVPVSAANFAGRGIPDLAGDASKASGYQIYVGGSGTTVGGTSAVAPLMAGLIALINEATTKNLGKTVGLINPLIYASSAQNVFRDITAGNNDIYGNLQGRYAAGPGWDACSGLGVPNGQSLLSLLNQ